MSNLIKITFVLALILGAGVALAQEDAGENATVTEEIALDEEVTPEDLNVGEPNILPDSPFYFLKEWGRNIQSFFTFNSVAKAKLREKFASEKLLEVKEMVEQNKSRERIEWALQLYQKEMDEVERVTQKIKERAEENVEVGKFLDKFIQHQALHQRALQKLEEQVPVEVYKKIEQVRNDHLEKFGEIMTRLESKERLQERLEKNLQELKGSEFKEFKNLEILKGLEEKVPQELKEIIQNVQENSLLNLKEKLEQLPAETQERFQEYIEKISGGKEIQMEIIENLKEELKEVPTIKEKLLQSREKILEQVKERVQEREMNCPEIEKPVAGFCQEGRIVAKRDERGCIISFGCVIPAEIEIPPQIEKPAACITLWDPVCGKDGKTYSNKCFAELAGIEIDYKGGCKEKECQTDADCPQLRCGPASTISARCIGVKAKCVEGKCQIISTTP